MIYVNGDEWIESEGPAVSWSVWFSGQGHFLSRSTADGWGHRMPKWWVNSKTWMKEYLTEKEF